jgi:putative transposase
VATSGYHRPIPLHPGRVPHGKPRAAKIFGCIMRFSRELFVLNMGSTFHSLHYHVVFSTKKRRPLIKVQWRERLHKYLGGTIRGLGAVPEMIGGVDDHVHLLLSLKTTEAPADIVREFKKASSVWAAERYDPMFAWQEGYAIFSVSWTHCKSVARYIARQETHHRKVPLVEELKRLLERNGITFDRRWLL